jgi:hypothetical protein
MINYVVLDILICITILYKLMIIYVAHSSVNVD